MVHKAAFRHNGCMGIGSPKLLMYRAGIIEQAGKEIQDGNEIL